MCGIIGISDPQGVDRDLFEIALDSLSNRGPDNAGLQSFSSGRVLLGHRRLSIIDLSSEGNQPLHNEDKTLWLTFNGEIYNYLELRKELEASSHTFATQTDSEVILHAFEEWGERCLDRFRGIFAFAIYDTIKDSFFLARDHFGTKPLYYYQSAGTFAFASQPSSINLALRRQPTIDDHWLKAYLIFGNVPGEGCIYSGIEKLPPGCYLRFHGRDFEIVRYAWQHQTENSVFKAESVEQRIRQLVQDSLQLNQRSDVPIAYFLSGGVDSSILCAIAQQNSSVPIHTFSVGFDDADSDETIYAEQASKAFGTRHHVAQLDFPRALKQIPSVIQSFDEPFNINGLIPYGYLCETVHDHGFKVAIGGDGADELFGGYLWQQSWWSRRTKTNFGSGRAAETLRRLLLGKAGHLQVENYLNHFLRDSGGINRDFLVSSGLDLQPQAFVQSALLWANERVHERSDLFPLAVDQECFLPDHCLVKVDRSSMRYGLEARVPFLDPSLATAIRQLDSQTLLGGGERKHLLKKLFASELESLSVNRKKGFSSPLASWWEKGLKHLANEVFKSSQLAQEHTLVNRILSLSQENGDVKSLVTLLSLCLWEDCWIGARKFTEPGYLEQFVQQSQGH